MAWNDFMLPMLREAISDTASTPVYSDVDLQRKILTAINLMNLEISFDIDYVADMVGLTLSPDPSTSSPVDYDFMSLAVLKTACLMERADVSKLTGITAIDISDNDFKIKTNDAGREKIDALKVNWCVAYNKAKADYVSSRNAGIYGKAIISPFPYQGDEGTISRRY